jgi:hypothetical protein
MTRGILLLCALALGCGASSDENGSELPSSCNPESERRGSYLMSTTEISGSCGPQATALVQLGPATAPGGSDSPCTPLGEPILTENDCKLETRTLCAFDDYEPGATIETTMVSTQQTQSGSLITGIMTMTLRDGFDGWVCTSTYSMRAERQ